MERPRASGPCFVACIAFQAGKGVEVAGKSILHHQAAHGWEWGGTVPVRQLHGRVVII